MKHLLHKSVLGATVDAISRTSLHFAKDFAL
jgi:hypothetical protein